MDIFDLVFGNNEDPPPTTSSDEEEIEIYHEPIEAELPDPQAEEREPIDAELLGPYALPQMTPPAPEDEPVSRIKDIESWQMLCPNRKLLPCHCPRCSFCLMCLDPIESKELFKKKLEIEPTEIDFLHKRSPASCVEMHFAAKLLPLKLNKQIYEHTLIIHLTAESETACEELLLNTDYIKMSEPSNRRRHYILDRQVGESPRHSAWRIKKLFNEHKIEISSTRLSLPSFISLYKHVKDVTTKRHAAPIIRKQKRKAQAVAPLYNAHEYSYESRMYELIHTDEPQPNCFKKFRNHGDSEDFDETVSFIINNNDDDPDWIIALEGGKLFAKYINEYRDQTEKDRKLFAKCINEDRDQTEACFMWEDKCLL